MYLSFVMNNTVVAAEPIIYVTKINLKTLVTWFQTSSQFSKWRPVHQIHESPRVIRGLRVTRAYYWPEHGTSYLTNPLLHMKLLLVLCEIFLAWLAEWVAQFCCSVCTQIHFHLWIHKHTHKYMNTLTPTPTVIAILIHETKDRSTVMACAK